MEFLSRMARRKSKTPLIAAESDPNAPFLERLQYKTYANWRLDDGKSEQANFLSCSGVDNNEEYVCEILQSSLDKPLALSVTRWDPNASQGSFSSTFYFSFGA